MTIRRFNLQIGSRLMAHFTGTVDRYGGIKVVLDDTVIDKAISGDQFSSQLNTSIAKWQTEKMRAAWFHVPTNFSHLIPPLVDAGFTFHHAKPDFAMLFKWISQDEPCNVPPYAFTNVGVGSIVTDANKRVLLVKERHPYYKRIWKYPGGYSQQGEDISETAVREVFEETGIRCKFDSIVAFRHYKKLAFDCSDIYVVCHLRPESESNLEVNKCEHEIADCQWFPINEIVEELSDFNRFVLEKYLESEKSGMTISLDQITTVLGSKSFKQNVYSIKSKKEESF